VIASRGYSQNRNDTICLNLSTAKKLAFFKINFGKLKELNKQQSELIALLNLSMKQKRKMIDLCYQKNDDFEKQILLLKQKSSTEITIEKTNLKTPFFIKIKYISIGIGVGGLLYTIFK